MMNYVKEGGFLHNPITGVTFKSNKFTICRPEFQRVSGPNPDAKEIEPIIKMGEGGTADLVPNEQVHIGGADASEALDEILKKIADASTKSDLRSVGTELGLDLPKIMTNKVMRKTIQDHVKKLKAFNI